MFGLRRRVRIAYEPIPWSAQGDKKNEEKKQPISEPLCFSKKHETYKIRRALAQGVSDHLFFVFIATFVKSVKQLLHFLDFVATFCASV